MESLIQLNNISKAFPQGKSLHRVLDDVNLTVEDGESIAILGPSGSGKSTLLSLIGLLDDYNQGEYKLRGQSVSDLSKRQKGILRNQHIGWIFQNFNLIANMTVLENVVQPMRYNKNIANKDYQLRAAEVLAQVGLADKLNMSPSQLSGGQQQRVAIARALVNKPQLILADEPTGNLDSATGQNIIELLLSLAEQGATVIIVTHDNNIAKQCSRQIRIHDGSIRHDD